MERVDYQTVLEGVADQAGLDRNLLSNAEFGSLRGFLARRLKSAWEYQLWPEVKVCEERWFRPKFSASASYTGTTELFDVRSQLYVQALRSNAPTIFSITRVGAVATVSMDGTHGLAVGDRVTISGCVQSEYNGTFLVVAVTGVADFTVAVTGTPASPATGAPALRVNPTGLNDEPAAAYWALCGTKYTGNDWGEGTAYAVGDVVRDVATGLFYQCYSAHTANSFTAPHFLNNFGVLTVFDRYVGYTQTGLAGIGTVLGVWPNNPRVYVKGQARSSVDSIEWWLSENGVQVLTSSAKSVWIEFKVRTPRLRGVAWSSTGVYTGGVSQVYFSDATTETAGNFYECVTTTAAGESPLTTPAKWAIVEIPRRFEQFLVYAGTRDWMLSQGQAEKWALLKVDVNELLSDQVMILKGQSGQEERLIVGTR